MLVQWPLIVYAASVLPGVDGATKKTFSNDFVQDREASCCEAKENFKDIDTSAFSNVSALGAYLGLRPSKSDCQLDCTSKDWCSAFMYGNTTKECWLFHKGCSNRCESRLFDFYTRVPTSFIFRGNGSCRYDGKETFGCTQPTLSAEDCIKACKKYAVCAGITLGSENDERTCHRHFTTKVRFNDISCYDGEKAPKIPEELHGSGSHNSTLCFAVSAGSSPWLALRTNSLLILTALLLCK